jgi:hypothetical protein
MAGLRLVWVPKDGGAPRLIDPGNSAGELVNSELEVVKQAGEDGLLEIIEILSSEKDSRWKNMILPCLIKRNEKIQQTERW